MKVIPIYKLSDVRLIQKILKDRPMELALFEVGINSALRGSDIVAMNVGLVRNLQIGDCFEVIEKKTGKLKKIDANKHLVRAVQRLLALRLEKNPELADSEPLFVGQRGRLTRKTVHFMVRNWCTESKLEGSFGSHTLRKTHGYHQRTRNGASIEQLMLIFNHSSPRQTMTYLCLQPEEIRDKFLSLEW